MDIVTHKEPSAPMKIPPCDVRSVSCPHSTILKCSKNTTKEQVLCPCMYYEGSQMVEMVLLSGFVCITWKGKT